MNIGIIGVGRLGLAYALIFEQKNFTVFASSYKKDYVETLKSKKIDSNEPGINDLLAQSKNLYFTIDNHQIIDNCDFIYVMVATPSTTQGDYDVSAVMDVARDLLNHPADVSGKILVVGSTVNPGTCDILQKMLDSRGVHVVYSPTFVAQGSVLENIVNPHTLSIGTENLKIAEQCKQIFGKIVTDNTPLYVMKPLTVEILKLAGNCRATLEISFFNMIGQILLDQQLEQDLESACKYLNFVKMNAKWQFGFGFGGPCYPRDNRAFVHFTKKIDLEYTFGNLVDDFNQDHVEWLTNYLISRNHDNLPFYFEYITYKRGVVITEESHQLLVCQNLLQKGKTVFVESSKFLSQEIQDQLTKQFENQIKFVKIQDIDRNDVYPVNF